MRNAIIRREADLKPTLEELGRISIDKQMEACIRMSESRREDVLCADCGVAIGEFPVNTDQADYSPFSHGKIAPPPVPARLLFVPPDTRVL